MRSSTERIFDETKAALERGLVGVGEIAALANVIPATVHRWRQRHPGFPSPVIVLSGSPLWLTDDVEVWLDETGRG